MIAALALLGALQLAAPDTATPSASAPATSPAPAAAPALPFAPPLGQPLTFQTVETRNFRDRIVHFTTTRRLRFAARANGFAMESTVVGAFTDAPEVVAAPFRANMEVTSNLPVTVLLARDGTPVDIEALDARWAEMLAGVDRQIATAARLHAPNDARIATIRDLRAHWAVLPAAERRAFLLDDAFDLLGFAQPALVPGAAQAYSVTASTPTGEPVTLAGSVTLAALDPATARFDVSAVSAPAEMDRAAATLRASIPAGGDPRMHAVLAEAAERLKGSTVTRRGSFTVDRMTGLLRQSERVTLFTDAAGHEREIERVTVRQLPG